MGLTRQTPRTPISKFSERNLAAGPRVSWLRTGLTSSTSPRQDSRPAGQSPRIRESTCQVSAFIVQVTLARGRSDFPEPIFGPIIHRSSKIFDHPQIGVGGFAV